MCRLETYEIYSLNERVVYTAYWTRRFFSFPISLFLISFFTVFQICSHKKTLLLFLLLCFSIVSLFCSVCVILFVVLLLFFVCFVCLFFGVHFCFSMCVFVLCVFFVYLCVLAIVFALFMLFLCYFICYVWLSSIFSHTTNLLLTYWPGIIIIIIIIFSLGSLSRKFTNHRTAREEGGHFFNSSLPLPPASQALRH